MNEELEFGDISGKTFRDIAHQAVDWIADYLENMDNYPVLSKAKPGDIKSSLPRSAPETAEDPGDILSDFEKIIVPGITHWNHPRFFAYFSITASYPGILAELLASAMNVNAMLWKTSPSATELEETVLNWLRKMLGLPGTFDGVINDTASVSSLCAMTAARESLSMAIREKGVAGRPDLPEFTIYTSNQSHSSIEKAAIVLGIGQENVRKIDTDSAFRMDADALRKTIAGDIKEGKRPVCVIATIGTTSTTSVDPVKAIVDICHEHGIWLHVDAAYGGSAALLPEMKSHFDGWERADSIVVNPHKWLFTPIDCSVLYCRKPEILKRAFSLTPEYLKTEEAGDVKNYMDYGVALGRRFRSLKLWFILRALGRRKIESIIRQHVAFAQELKQEIEAHPEFELLAPAPFSTLVFRYAPDGAKRDLNALNEDLLIAVNRTGDLFLSHTKLHGIYGIRLAIGNIKTTREDIALAWRIIQREAARNALK
ncbi:MAG: aminotransferase class V-fold PLP-dependent enzyme [candidate division KSB1 bacterium]|jgi:aromatic-L-amino-acid decarboxylase|nr:aminotransferase class V-fold PLP-dependent enzyme [candidate division KSB1 bacterium]